jgi:hypothetical protein
MRTLGKVMALAVLALVAGTASAATVTMANNGPKLADGATLLTITVTVADNGTYNITAPAGVTAPASFVVAGNTGTFDVVSSIAGNYLISVAEVAGTLDTGSTTVAFIQNTLDVTITVTLTVPVQVALNDGTNDVATITWNLPGKSLATTYVSNVDNATVVDVKNNGGAAVNVKAQLQSPGSWIATTQLAGSTLIDRFWVNATGADTTAQLVVAPSVLPITNSIAPNTSSSTVLTLHTPTTVSTVTSGNIIVRYVAANN